MVTACSTGAHAIGDAARLIVLDDADVMVAGGAEAAICRIGVAGFAAARALSTDFNDTPERASRPWDQDRDGFVMGEGAGIVVLEELEHATRARRQDLRRGGRLRPVGRRLPHHRAEPGRRRRLSLDAGRAEARRHDARTTSTTSTRTAPRPRSATRSSSARSSGCSAMPPTRLSMSSTKSAIGHLLGAAGSVEAIFSLLAMHDQIVPPTLNLDDPSRAATSTWCRTRRAAARCVRRCPTPSASAAPTPA